MILAANAELALSTTADMADHLIDTITLTVTNVTPPPQHVTHLQSEMADLQELHAVQHQSCPPSCTPCGDREREPPYFA